MAPLDFPIQRIREDFPILHQEIHGKPLIYLDSAASAQQPRQVVETMVTYAYQHHANVHRGVHSLSQRATTMLEEARNQVQHFLGAGSVDEIVFTRGATESLNLVAFGWAARHLQSGDEILLTELEHHANLVPWQEVSARTGAVLRFVPVSTDNGQLDTSAFSDCLSERTRLVSISHASNVTGEILPVASYVREAQARGAVVLLDGAQAAPHIPVDVVELGCDFYAFSGHKMCGPTGIGALYGKAERLEEMAPCYFGGGMIDKVNWQSSAYQPPPHRFEAGTPPIAAAIGLAAAISYLEAIGLDAIASYEHGLLQRAQERLADIDICRFLGPSDAGQRVAVLSLICDRPGASIHPYDLGQFLDAEGVAIRTGNHCAQPLMTKLQCVGSARMSFAFYNTIEEVDAAMTHLAEAVALLAG